MLKIGVVVAQLLTPGLQKLRRSETFRNPKHELESFAHSVFILDLVKVVLAIDSSSTAIERLAL